MNGRRDHVYPRIIQRLLLATVTGVGHWLMLTNKIQAGLRSCGWGELHQQGWVSVATGVQARPGSQVSRSQGSGGFLGE